jgi:hypothetical protein
MQVKVANGEIITSS